MVASPVVDGMELAIGVVGDGDAESVLCAVVKVAATDSSRSQGDFRMATIVEVHSLFYSGKMMVAVLDQWSAQRDCPGTRDQEMWRGEFERAGINF